MEPTAPNPNSSSPAKPVGGARPLSVEDRLYRLEDVFNSAPVGLCYIDLDFRYVTVNECFAAMYGHRCEHFPGRTVREALPAVADQIMAHLEHSLRTQSKVSVELTLAQPTGGSPKPRSLVYLRTAQPMRDTTGTMVGFSVALIDITERKAAEAALRESEENFRNTVDLNPHIPWMADANGNMLEISPRYAALTGVDRHTADRDGSMGTIHSQERAKVMQLWESALTSGAPYDATYRMLCAGDEWRWVRARAFPRGDASGRICRWYGTLEDIHERTLLDEAFRTKTTRLEEVSAQLVLLVREDHLTGLANRRHFDETLLREMVRARRSRRPLALILFDVDYFKRYNDTYGHPAGDACLRSVGQTLKDSLRRQGDLAARYGGEEFVILLPDTPEEGAVAVAHLISEAVRALEINHVSSDLGFLTLSAGVASFDPHDDLPHRNACNNLIQAADLALYAAKTAGRNCAVSSRALNDLHIRLTEDAKKSEGDPKAAPTE